MQEEWKPIDGWDGYKVSNFGRVLGKRGTILHQQKTNCGYMSVHLSNGKIKKWCSVHRLVASAFIPNDNNLPNVNHIDEVKDNNIVTNLEWCSVSYNQTYNNKGQRMIQTKRGKRIPIVPQSATDGHIRALSKPVVCVETNKEFRSASEVSRSMGLSAMAVMNAIRFNRRSGGYHWRYIND